MAGARPGVHVVRLKQLQVAESLVNGNKFVKWDDDSNIAVPVTLRVDPKGYYLYWQDQNKETDCLDMSVIRDARTGKYARLPKDSRLRDAITIGSQDTSVEDKTVTVAYGTDMVNIFYINFTATSKDIAREWAFELFRYATNLLALNNSPLQFLEKCWTKLAIVTTVNGKIPIKNIMKMFAQNKDDRKRVKQAIDSSDLKTVDKGDEFLERLSFREFLKFYRTMTGRSEVDRVFHQLGAGKTGYLTAEQFMNFLNREQRDPRLNEILYPYYDVRKSQQLIELFEGGLHSASATEQQPTLHIGSNHKHLTAEGFLLYLLSGDNVIVPPDKLDLNEDMTQPLSHYFINSSHNTYLSGHQLTGKSSVEIYRQVLLTGCRCVELDCWDGKGSDEEPIITHGFTMCTDILLKDALEAIAEAAFKVSDYPVILSFENHCSTRQQVKIATYCRNIFGEHLLTDPVESYPVQADVPLPSPELMKRKILIKNKKSEALPSADAADTLTLDESGVSELEFSDVNTAAYETICDINEDDDKKRGAHIDEPKAIEEMSSLVLYVQPARFHSFEVAEKFNRSYECTSFSETQATALLKEFPVEFVNFNKRQLSRIYPKGTRVDSSNYMPQIFWNAGCQLVALNFQTLDLAMQLNLGTFEYNGRSGYILKPDFMRRRDRQFDPFAESTVDGIVAGTVHVKIISGQFLTDRRSGSFVEVEMYGLPADTVRRKFRTKVIPGNAINPVYDEDPFVFRKVVLPNLAILRIAVYNDNGTVLLGHRILPVESLRPGYRHISLRNECNQPQGVATLFVHIRVTDYIPDAFADFAAALVNPIAYQSQLEKHSCQLAILEDFDSESSATCIDDNDITSVNAAETMTSPGVTFSKTVGNQKSGSGQGQMNPAAVKRAGSVSSKGISNQQHEQFSATTETTSSSSSSQTLTKSSSVPNSPHHTGPSTNNDSGPCKLSSGHKSRTTRLLDVDVFDPLSLDELRENKQFVKMVAKYDKDIDLLKKKHEKIQQTKLQNSQTEEERLSAAHARARSAFERTVQKPSRRQRSTDDSNSSVNDTQQQLSSLVASQEQELSALKIKHRQEQAALCCSQYRTELDVQLTHVPIARSRLEQLLTAAKDTRVVRLKRVHDSEVSELKKKLDAQNWEEMKALAKKHRDKNELARVRREATQKHITMAVQERQKLRDLLEQRLTEVQSQYDHLIGQLTNTYKQEEEKLKAECERRCQQVMKICEAAVTLSTSRSQSDGIVDITKSETAPNQQPQSAAREMSDSDPDRGVHRTDGDVALSNVPDNSDCVTTAAPDLTSTQEQNGCIDHENMAAHNDDS